MYCMNGIRSTCKIFMTSTSTILLQMKNVYEIHCYIWSNKIMRIRNSHEKKTEKKFIDFGLFKKDFQESKQR